MFACAKIHGRRLVRAARQRQAEKAWLREWFFPNGVSGSVSTILKKKHVCEFHPADALKSWPDLIPLLLILAFLQTDPAGTYSAWKANAIGGSNSNNMREFLEKNWADDMDEGAAKKLCMKV